MRVKNNNEVSRMDRKSKIATAVAIGVIGCVSIAALIGIGVRMRNNDAAETQEVIEEQPVTEETEVVVEVPEEVIVTEPEDDGIVIDLSTDDVEITGEGDEIVQELQEEPEIPEVPTEAPELAEDTDLTNPDVVPEYADTEETEEKPEETPIQESSTPDSTGHEGEIYFPGFGWTEYEGPSYSIPAPDCVTNGVHVGEM